MSALGAVATDLHLASGAITWIRWYGAAAFVVAFGLARLRRPVATGFLFGSCYLVPAIIASALGQFIAPFFCIWIAGLLGIICASGRWWRWSLPPAFRLPVAFWALVVAISWPLICLREDDFTMASIGWNTSNTSVGVPPFFAAMDVANAAAITLAGLLLIDWIVAEYGTADKDTFARDVVRWLALSAALSVAVAIYQAAVNIEFLNGGVFPGVGRASGTMRDANPYGVLTALWGPAAVALIVAGSGQCSSWLMTIVLLMSWIGAWVSGSRNSLIAGAVGIAFVVCLQVRELSRSARLALVATFAVVAALAGTFTLIVRSSVTSPVARFGELARSVALNKGASPLDLLERLWDPYGYGVVAWRMIREYPLFGVGVGTFNLVVIDYAKSTDFIRISFDNAQNWFRHQFAELGVVGSLGWIAWTALFAFLVATARPRSESNRKAANLVRVLPVLVVLVSLVGMPAMNAAASITFALFAAWYLVLVGTERVDALMSFATRRSAWIAAWAVALVFVSGTFMSARAGLRPPHRAVRFGWDYSYGLYGPETDVDGTEFRWAAKDAVAVIDSPAPWMKVTVGVNYADVGKKPVDVRVLRDGKTVISAHLTSTDPVVRYVRVPTGKPRIMLETHVSRVVRPADFGSPDDRELGLMVKWLPVFAVPADGTLVE